MPQTLGPLRCDDSQKHNRGSECSKNTPVKKVVDKRGQGNNVKR
jgi:hypothetical protein